MERILCGVDPGLGITGYAVMRVRDNSPSIVDAGTLRTDDRLELPDRLRQLDEEFAAVLREHTPHVVAIEELYSHYKHPRTSILMGHARGVLLCAAARAGVLVTPYAATQVKKHLTGNGHATKPQIQRAVAHSLGLKEPPEPPDVADALALALCCAGEEWRMSVST